jgi:phage replication O-like protein O
MPEDRGSGSRRANNEGMVRMRKISGYEAPNYTQTPNELFDLIPEMGIAELKVTLVVVRKTLGWHKREDRISLTQLQELTGLSRQGVIDGILDAVARGTVKQHKHETGSHSYSLVVKPVDQTSQASRPVASQASRPTKETVNTLTKEMISPLGEYIRLFAFTPSPMDQETLNDLQAKYPSDRIVACIQEIHRRGVSSLKYAAKMLADGWPDNKQAGGISADYEAARLAQLSEVVNG